MNDAAMSVIETELYEMADRLRAGDDAAPGRRARLEGHMACLIRTGQVNGERLCEIANALLGDDGELWIETDGAPRLALWQRRAPVWPTTTD